MTYRENLTQIKNTLELARNKFTNEIQMTAQRAYHSRKFDPKVQQLKNEQAASLEPLNEIVLRLSRAKTAIRRLNDAADAAKKTAADAFPAAFMAKAKELLAEPVYDRMKTENPLQVGAVHRYVRPSAESGNRRS
jgi:hypothetical protein